MNPKAVKNIRRVERPRPLRLSSDNSLKAPVTPPANAAVVKKPFTDVLSDIDALHISISNCLYDETTAADISKMCNILKSRGHELDLSMKDHLDHYFVTLRNASREERLDFMSRLRLLEVIELRAMGWRTNENLTNYYRAKILELEQGSEKALVNNSAVPNFGSHATQQQQQQLASPSIGIPLTPGEILRSSGKFAKPTKIAGKNYFKDEVIIRNSDSGKVMGIKGRRVHMIEELSDTIISFQRVNPGARDRLVQITGPHEDSISHAKLLVEDTIRRNASPIRDKNDALDMDGIRNEGVNRNSYIDLESPNFSMKKLTHSFSMGDATLGEYAFRINIGQDAIRISGSNSDLLKTAKLVLQEYFAGQAELDDMNHRDSSPVNQSLLSNFQNTAINDNSRYGLTKMPSKNSLQRSSSWRSSGAGSRTSVSPLESSDDDEEIFRHKEISPKNSTVTPASIGTYNFINYLETQEIPPDSNKHPTVPEYSSRNNTPLSSSATGLNESSCVQFPLRPFSALENDNDSNLQKPSYEGPLPFPFESLDPNNALATISPGRLKLSYSRDFLMKCAESPHCDEPPKFNVEAVERYPMIFKDNAPKQSGLDSGSKIN